MYSETAFLRDSELQLSLLHHYILFISDQHLWYDGCLHWNSLKAKKITLHWSVNIMNLYQGATQNMKLPLYLRMNILKTIPLWIQFNFSLSNNIIYISGWNLRYVTNHLIFYSFNTFILISVFSNLFWSFNMGRKWKGNGPAAQQDDGEASGQLQDYGAAAGRRRDDGAATGRWRDAAAEWRRIHGMTEKTWDNGGITEMTRDDSGMVCHVEEQELKGWTKVDHVSWCHCSTFKRGPFRVVLQMLNLQLDVQKKQKDSTTMIVIQKRKKFNVWSCLNLILLE